jgi:hypothetical protein
MRSETVCVAQPCPETTGRVVAFNKTATKYLAFVRVSTDETGIVGVYRFRFNGLDNGSIYR